MRVLMVEDNEDDFILARDALAENEFELHWVKTIPGAHETIVQGDIDVILLDLALEASSGLGTFDAVNFWALNIPIVILTGLDNDTVAIVAVQRGAQDYFLKSDITGGTLAKSLRYAVERNNAAREHAQLAVLVECSNDAIISRSLDGQILTWNKAAERIFGYSAEEAIGQPASILLPADEANAVMERWTQMEGPGPYETVHLSRKNGKLISVLQTISPINDHLGRTLGTSLIVRDVTRREQDEEARRWLAGQITNSQQRDDFVSALLHDIKMPLDGADRLLTHLLDGTVGKFSLEQLEGVLMLKSSNTHLLELIQRLVQVYRYDSTIQSVHFERTDIAMLINQTAEIAKSLMQERQLQISVSVAENLKSIVCDASAIRRLLMNLLDNAAKFSPDRGAIEISAENSDGGVTIYVRDEGSGIAPEDLSRLFDQWWQGEPGKKYVASTGLGLYLCRKIMDAHNGKLKCSSKLNFGTTFTIMLPDNAGNEEMGTGMPLESAQEYALWNTVEAGHVRSNSGAGK